MSPTFYIYSCIIPSTSSFLLHHSTMSSHPPPPPDGTPPARTPPARTPPAGIQLCNRRLRRPDDEKFIQFELDKELLNVWVYLPPFVRKSAVYDEIVDCKDKRFHWQDAVRLRVAVLEEIRKNGMNMIL